LQNGYHFFLSQIKSHILASTEESTMLEATETTDMTGFDRIDDELRQYIESNLEGVANNVADLAREYCPVKTGKLKKSIKVEERDDGYRVITRDAKAHLLEFGHVQEDRKGNIVGHVPPYPFLRPAREAVINDLLRYGGRNYDFAKSSGLFDNYWKG